MYRKHLKMALALTSLITSMVAIGIVVATQPDVSDTGSRVDSPLPSEAASRHRHALMEKGNQIDQQARAEKKAGNFAGAERTCHQEIAYYKSLPELRGNEWKIVSEAPRQILGDIYLQEGYYQRALNAYGIGIRYWHDYVAGCNLDFAWAYCGLRNYTAARRYYYYSDQSLLQYSNIAPDDLPGTANPTALKTSILLARGVDAYFHDSNQDAFAYLASAAKLAPTNGLIPYFQGKALLNMYRNREALPYFVHAVAFGHGKFVKDARERIHTWPASTREQVLRQRVARKP